MRSASPSTRTAGGAGIAEASPAGEKSGRGADTGPSQDGETPTVNQSREWPFRDTAPRQDPAEDRLDPIWGTDPPDAVRWHMDMTPDPESNTSRSPTRQQEPPHDPAAAGRSSPASPPSAFAPSSTTDSPSSPVSSTAVPLGTGESDVSVGQDAVPTLRGSGPVARTDAPDDQDHTAPPDDAVTNGPLAQQGSIPQPRPALRERAARGRGDSQVAEPSEQTASQVDLGDGGQVMSGPPAQGSAVDLGHGTSSPPGQGSGAVRAGEAATVLDPPGAGSTGSGTSSGGSAEPSSRAASSTAAERSAGEDPRPPHHTGTEVGWFSPEQGASRYAETLSERLSAERPSEEPGGRSWARGISGRQSPFRDRAHPGSRGAPGTRVDRERDGPRRPRPGDRLAGSSPDRLNTRPARSTLKRPSAVRNRAMNQAASFRELPRNEGPPVLPVPS